MQNAVSSSQNGFSKSWKLHTVIAVAMYSVYAYEWIDNCFLYSGRAGWSGFELFMVTLFTAPFYMMFHLYTLYVSVVSKNKPVLIISGICIFVCMLHTALAFS